MAVVSSVTTLKIQNAANSYRQVVATAASQDSPAGSSLVVTTVQSQLGTLAPAQPDTLTLDIYADDGQTLVRSLVLSTANGTQTSTFYLTVDGTAAGSFRCGTLRMRVRAVNTTAAPGSTYDINSDNGAYGSPASTLPTGFSTSIANQGWVRSTSTLVVATSNVGFGGAVPALFAYPDSLFQRATLGHATFSPVAFTLTIYNAYTPVPAVRTGATNTTTGPTFDRNQGIADNGFPISSQLYGQDYVLPTSALTGLAYLALYSGTVSNINVDSRITITHLLQLNTNAYATPPSASNVASGQRLTSDLGFISARMSNARAEGLNSITYNATLQDSQALVTGVVRTGVVTGTQGGQQGWGALAAWADALPTGTWNKTVTITAPANATGLEVGASRTYQLIAPNPNLRLVCGAAPATVALDGRHFSPGVPLVVGLAVANTTTGVAVAPDTGTAAAAIIRFNLAFGRIEYLDADGITWVPVGSGTYYYHTLTVSPGDAKAFTKTFTAVQTAGYGTSDLFIVGRAQVAGVPVSGFDKEISVSSNNRHDDLDALTALIIKLF